MSIEKLKEESYDAVNMTTSNVNKKASTESLTESVNLNPNGFDKPENFPDGGKEAYLVLFGTFLAFGGVLGTTNGIGAIESYVSSNILSGLKQSTVAWIFSLFSFSTFALGIFCGPLCDQLGARVMCCIGWVLFTLGFMCVSACTKYYQFLLSFIVCGVGQSFVFVTCVTTLNQWFYKRRATALGVSYCAGALGGIALPLILTALFDRIGFGWSIRIVGFIFSFLLACSVLLIKDRRAEFGIGQAETTENRLFTAVKNIDILCFKDRTYTLLTIACIGNSGPFFLVLNYLVSFAVAVGLDSKSASYLIIALNATSMIGRIGGGLLADRYGKFNFFVGLNIVSCLAMFILWLPQPIGHTKAGLYVFSSIYGVTSGSYLQASPSCMGQISKTEEFSRRYGTFCFVVALFNLVLVPIGGAIVKTHDNIQGFDNMVIFAAVLSFMGLVMSIACRIDHAGLKWTIA